MSKHKKFSIFVFYRIMTWSLESH